MQVLLCMCTTSGSFPLKGGVHLRAYKNFCFTRGAHREDVTSIDRKKETQEQISINAHTFEYELFLQQAHL